MDELPKKAFEAWEGPTARSLEQLLRSPRVLEPLGALLTGYSRLRAAREEVVCRLWASLGLPTRRDQERTLHALHQLESRLLDLEERLAERR